MADEDEGESMLTIVTMAAVGAAAGLLMRTDWRRRATQVVGVTALACGSVLFIETFGAIGLVFPVALVLAALLPDVLPSRPHRVDGARSPA